VATALVVEANNETPTGLRDLDIESGCAADYDGWLVAVGA